MNNILITGGYGCIGAQTARWLVANTTSTITIASRSMNAQRNERVFHDVDSSRLQFAQVDVRDQPQLERLLVNHEITHAIHMAALQTPDCDANRDLGLQVNLGGTQNLIEAIKATKIDLQRLIFASSIAVYGPRASYPSDQVPMLAEPNPVNVYGAWKLAGESVAKFFQQDTGIATISLRPGVLFGPGRDAGLTSTPTTAIKCAALGLPYQIPFRSRQDYQFSADVGAAVGNALIEPFSGYGVFTLPGQTYDTHQIVSELESVATEMGLGHQCKITIGENEVPFICDLEFQPFKDAFPKVPLTSLADALHQSLEFYIDQANRGWLTAQTIG